MMILASNVAYAQVQIHQSQSSTVNGHSVSSSVTSNGQKILVHTDKGILVITGDKLTYCINQACAPVYSLHEGGTITK